LKYYQYFCRYLKKTKKLEAEKQKIFCIDNELSNLSMLSERLVGAGFITLITSIKDFMIEKLKNSNAQLIILGIHNFDDIEILKLIKSDHSTADLPIFVYSSIKDDFFEITAYKNGVYDFMDFPVRMIVLIAKIEAYFKRQSKTFTNSILKANGIEINANNYGVKFQSGRQVYLPKKDFLLLTFLAEHAGQIFNRNELLNSIWGNDVYIGERTVDVHIRRLREKIGGEYIKTHKGIGYMFPKN
jgi:two-component system, OmpR family, alkaline phosphatase synthesis response regulator PhoP